MISFTLKCAQDHQFESWFASSKAFDSLLAAGQVTCPVCGDHDISKSLMAPRVSTTEEDAPPPPSLSAPATKEEAALNKLRAEIEANSENVGLRFADEARAMHQGDIPERAIHGEARADQARKLLEDGVPVMPLPFTPKNRTN